MCITRKVVIKMPNIFIITCASQGKLVKGCGVYISSRVYHKESCCEIAVCIYHHVGITRKVGKRLWSLYIITCASQGKVF